MSIILKSGKLSDGRVITPYPLVKSTEKYKKIEFIYNYPRLHYINLPKVRDHRYFKDIDTEGHTYTLRTRNYAFKIREGMLCIGISSNRMQSFLCTVDGNLSGVIDNSTFKNSSSAVKTILRQFIRQFGVSLNDIYYLDRDQIDYLFIKEVEYRLEDTLPEEQEKVSNLAIQYLLDSIYKEEEKCTELPF